MTEQRLIALERRTDTLARRLSRLEALTEGAPMVQRPVRGSTQALPPSQAAGAPAQGPAARPPAPAPAVPDASGARTSIEDLLGGRVLAWLGAVAVIFGVAFFFAYAVSRGLIGEGARTLLAAGGSLALLAAGVWLHE